MLMMLTDHDIQIFAKEGMIEPFNLEHLQPASYDMELDSVNKRILKPGESTLGVTRETIRVPEHVVGMVFGKSSLARDFLSVHYAGFVDPGFRGQIILEITNHSDKDIDLFRYETMAQIAFIKLTTFPNTIYEGHYQDQKGITPNWMNQEGA